MCIRDSISILRLRISLYLVFTTFFTFAVYGNVNEESLPSGVVFPIFLAWISASVVNYLLVAVIRYAGPRIIDRKMQQNKDLVSLLKARLFWIKRREKFQTIVAFSLEILSFWIASDRGIYHKILGAVAFLFMVDLVLLPTLQILFAIPFKCLSLSLIHI
eukprot:TRINITY_DN10117_c0_g1_i1.p1 TRINITY_DN10117_c0_g1~~TRINITY_DN10117_c0_g1_i1.p1  ORF type:complete len:179 (+),score=26.00 TRINITY_DN10117_c0_g1_i1:60-539(+)